MSQKPLIAIGTIGLVCAIGYTNIYLPLYSDVGKARRDEYLATGKVQKVGVEQGGLSKELNKGSMWTNLEKGIKGIKGTSEKE